MTRRLTVTPRARADLADIAVYIARDNPAASDRLVDLLAERSRFLAEFPGVGRPYPGRNARVLPVGQYLILYRESPDGVTVLRYYHGRRDPGRM